MQDPEKYLKDIANFNLQKYATALAFAIIKIKPDNVTTDDFCAEIRERYQNDTRNISYKISTQDFYDEHVQLDGKCYLSQQFSSTPLASQDLNYFQNSSSHIDSQTTVEFEFVLAAENVKRIICTLTGTNPFEEYNLTCDSVKDKGNSQDSGYRSLPNNTETYKRKQSDLRQLNKSLHTLIKYMDNITNLNYNKEIVDHVSKTFGIALDELYKLNIYLSFYDIVMNILDNIINSLQNPELEKIVVEDLLLKFELFNNSHILIHHSMAILIEKLRMSMEKILLCNPADAVEIKEPETINYMFYLFHFLEYLFKKKSRSQSKIQILESSKNTDITNKKVSFQLKTGSAENIEFKYDNEQLNNEVKKLLNNIILKCSESYPLLAFWAMECHNIYIKCKSYILKPVHHLSE